MKYLVNYATKEFYKSQERLNASALKHGIDKVISYRENDIKNTEFYKQNKQLLEYQRGGGYWIWKPYIILETLLKARKNDIVIYCDSGIEIIRSLDPLFQLCMRKSPILLFSLHWAKNKEWIKRDCFVLMNCDTPEYWNATQLMSGFCVFRKTARNIKFVQEWLRYCCNENIVTDKENICGTDNFPEFREHRHDQAILSLLSIKYHVEIFRSPTPEGDPYKMKEFWSSDTLTWRLETFTNSPYHTLLNVHRERHWD